MPAQSQSQAHLARMALAHKAGHTLTGVSKAGMAKVRSMASMSEADLRDFAHVAKRK